MVHSIIAKLSNINSLQSYKLLQLQNKAQRLTKENFPLRYMDQFTDWYSWPVATDTRRAVEKKRQDFTELTIGKIDADGRVLGFFGDLPDCNSVNRSEFSQRERTSIDIVLKSDKVLVRKDFRGDRKGFIYEWYSLAFLSRWANVPSVFEVDNQRQILYKNLIPGRTIRDILVDSGANILNVGVKADLRMKQIPASERIREVWKRGKEVMSSALTNTVIEALNTQIEAIHRHGMVNLSMTYGNVVIDHDGLPWLIDFEGVQIYGNQLNPLFQIRRMQDRAKFRALYQ